MSQDWRRRKDGTGSGCGDGGERGAERGRVREGGRYGDRFRHQAPSLNLFVTRDLEARNQHDMRAFVMAARHHAEFGKLSEVSMRCHARSVLYPFCFIAAEFTIVAAGALVYFWSVMLR